MFSCYSIYKLLLRLIVFRSSWRFNAVEFCVCCNQKTFILYSKILQATLWGIIKDWCGSALFKAALLERENYFCNYCTSNYRKRVHAESVLKLLGIEHASEFVDKVSNDKTFSVYETAAYNVFRAKKLKSCSNYVVSEYFDNRAFGDSVDGVRNETLEALTFPDNSFDVVINSDVLEHVADLGKALQEVQRVLKPGGYHVFTVPVDPELSNTIERARVVNGRIEHLLEPIMHGDTIRDSGILAFRDFGADIMGYTSREGLICREIKYCRDGNFVTSVYYAQKQ